MIGTDWPVCTLGISYAEWWRLVEEWIAPLSTEERAQILGGTAARVYRL
jgi:L-fuconolactonase